MKTVSFGTTGLTVPAVAVGCMRLSGKTPQEMAHFIHHAVDAGAVFFDHADIYGGGESERVFGRAMALDGSVKREDLILQSKCCIRKGMYDMSKEYILEAVDGILERLQTEYLDVLLLHRPDALVEPQEVAEAFNILERSGKVRHFGVSNHKPMQIELLKKCVSQPICANQLQLSLPVSNMIANGMEVNMTSDGAPDRDGSVLDYCRVKDITIQAWSPFQMPNWGGPFVGNPACGPLNEKLEELAGKYGVSPTTVAAAWILRHPAQMQVIAGTSSESRLSEIIAASDVSLTRKEWYELYLAAGHILP